MKATLTVVLCALMLSVAAQTRIEKSVPVKDGQTIRMKFDYPNVIRVSTWEKNEVSITGTVSINSGENDDAFELITSNSGSMVSIRNDINDMKNLPKRITIHKDGQKITFRDKESWRKYQEENGRSQNVNIGIDIEIELIIKVPRNVETYVESVYGMVEVREFSGPLSVQATYGGVDAALAEKNVGELVAETNYGNIYSNLDMNVNNRNSREEDFHTYVSARPGTGPAYRFESPYGNVYLRKEK